VAQPSLLVPIFIVWAVTSLSVGAAFVRRAPSVTVALFGSVFGAVAGFLVGNADGPAEVPAYTAVGASVGLFACGVLGLLVTSAHAPSARLRRGALLVLIAAPFASAALTVLLQSACPLYVTGKRAGFCAFQQDVVSGWISGVIVAFVFDALFVAALLLASASQVRRSERRDSPS
jgi:hypothetical protein